MPGALGRALAWLARRSGRVRSHRSRVALRTHRTRRCCLLAGRARPRAAERWRGSPAARAASAPNARASPCACLPGHVCCLPARRSRRTRPSHSRTFPWLASRSARVRPYCSPIGLHGNWGVSIADVTGAPAGPAASFAEARASPHVYRGCGPPLAQHSYKVREGYLRARRSTPTNSPGSL